ncbi:MAG: hypothetical protein HYV32_03580 [Candidatus Kerfeldbacteria bacterium]|nr:hypothetical protein [Candidatus Kerfeldbacteria bacterium]
MNKKDLLLLENAIISYGVVVTFEQLQKEAQKFTQSEQYIHKWIDSLIKKGWLVRLKRKLYFITSMESLGSVTVSPMVIAQNLEPQSYVSCEAALQYHGMFDQLLQTVRSVTTEKQQSRTIQGIYYQFIRTQAKYYFGFTQEVVENNYVNIATPEKALLDLLHFDRTFRSVDIVKEKLQEHYHNLNISQLIVFLEKEQTLVQRMMGFLFDQQGIDFQEIHAFVSHKKGYSKMTTDSTEFNAKWRLYYHSHFRK